MNKEVKNLFFKITDKNARTIEKIEYGFNSYNYLINDSYVLRIPLEEKDETINYIDEKKIFDLVSPLNIGEKVIYFDETDGIKLSKFIHGTRFYYREPTQEQIVYVAKTIKKLHKSKILSSNDYDMFNKLKVYKSPLNPNSFIEEGYEKRTIKDLEKIFDKEEKVFSHNDLVKGNLLFKFNSLSIIDWEYAGMNHPYFDLASFISENNLNDSQQDFFLKKFFGSDFNSLIKKRVLMFCRFQNILFYYWALYLYKKRDLEVYKKIAQEKLINIAQDIKNCAKN